MDFELSRPSAGTDGDEASGEESGGEGSTLGSLGCACPDDGLDKKAAQFTQYSMTSSVVPRSEGQQLLVFLGM